KYLGRGGSRKKLDPFYHAMEFAGNFYGRNLQDSKLRKNAIGYLKKRGLDKETIEYFRLGLAPPGWDNLYRAATENGIDRETMLKLKLVLRSRGGSGYRDYFRNRLIFPIFNITGRMVGLAGRVLDSSEPKYLNTVESPIYSKGRILYGLNFCRDNIRKSKSAILVEGYMDLIMLWKAGFRNVCAVCGTSFTPDQSRLLARYAKRVYIINDGDRAGVKAAVRAADQLLIEGLEPRIVVLPEGEDPDSFVRNRGSAALKELIRSSSDYFRYLRTVAGEGEENRFRRGQVIKHLIGTVSGIENSVDRDLCLQDISELFDIPVKNLREQLKKGRGRRKQEQLHTTSREKAGDNEKLLFRLGLEKEEFAEKILENLLEDDLEGELLRKYFHIFKEAVEEGMDVRNAEFFGRISDSEVAELATEIAFMDLPPGPGGRLLNDTLLWIKRNALRKEMEMMKERIESLRSDPDGGSSGEEIEIAEAYRRVASELKNLGLQGGNTP
ncbi:MAG: toprim domain-containing protein, partial [Candidatus Latescibacteria bacterium]|nr:toprim domain-containing protein [bacterium]MBD3423351.1 toprim domain-containing protein [Candidatus Latescibacterota bacterium]